MKTKTAVFFAVATLITGLGLYLFQKASISYQYDDEMNDLHGNFAFRDYEDNYGIEHLK